MIKVGRKKKIQVSLLLVHVIRGQKEKMVISSEAADGGSHSEAGVSRACFCPRLWSRRSGEQRARD